MLEIDSSYFGIINADAGTINTSSVPLNVPTTGDRDCYETFIISGHDLELFCQGPKQGEYQNPDLIPAHEPQDTFSSVLGSGENIEDLWNRYRNWLGECEGKFEGLT